ncbi:hypothetical protein ACTTAL_16610 [Rhodobacter capsulatus]
MKRPVILELDAPPASPAEAPPVIDQPAFDAPPQGRAMQIAAKLAARPRSRLTRFFWQATGALVGFLITVALWNFVTGLFAANPMLGWVATGLFDPVPDRLRSGCPARADGLRQAWPS